MSSDPSHSSYSTHTNHNSSKNQTSNSDSTQQHSSSLYHRSHHHTTTRPSTSPSNSSSTNQSSANLLPSTHPLQPQTASLSPFGDDSPKPHRLGPTSSSSQQPTSLPQSNPPRPPSPLEQLEGGERKPPPSDHHRDRPSDRQGLSAAVLAETTPPLHWNALHSVSPPAVVGLPASRAKASEALRQTSSLPHLPTHRSSRPPSVGLVVDAQTIPVMSEKPNSVSPFTGVPPSTDAMRMSSPIAVKAHRQTNHSDSVKVQRDDSPTHDPNSNTHNSENTEVGSSLNSNTQRSLAVIPFYPPSPSHHSLRTVALHTTTPHHNHRHASDDPPLSSSRTNWSSPNAQRPPSPGQPREGEHESAPAGALVPLCPTCHRPLEAPFSNGFDAVPHNRFPPQYFRQLAVSGPPPLLAIEDVQQPSRSPSSATNRNTLAPAAVGASTSFPASSALGGFVFPNTLVGSSPSTSNRFLSALAVVSNRSTGAGLPILPETSPPRDRFQRSTTSHGSSNANTPRHTHHSRRRSRRRSSVTPEQGGGGSHRRTQRPSLTLDSQPGLYSYVSPTTATEADAGPVGGRPDADSEPLMDAELAELLARHLAHLRGEKTEKELQEEAERANDVWAVEEEALPSSPAVVEPQANPSYYERYFLESKKLGSGTFGGVYLCMHVMEGVPLGTFALKKIPVGDNIIYLQHVLREVRILEEVKRHPNVIEYNHSWVDVAKMADFGPPVRCLFILMEYANEGALDSYLERHSPVISTMAVWYFFLSAVAGTAHLHQKNILHRDLKPQNLLLSARSRDAPPRVLVSDFGTAALLSDHSCERTGGTGTLEYMAPELFERDPTAPPEHEKYLYGHTKASDVWSLGMILHFLACATALPKRGPLGNVLLDVPGTSPVPRPPEMVELIRAMLQLDPMKRPSCKDILRSTVAQTLLSSFNNTQFSALDLFAPLCNPFPRNDGTPGNGEGVPYSSEDDRSTTATDMESVVMESSRVELLSTLAVTTPLLQQYQSSDLRAGVGSPTVVHPGVIVPFGGGGGPGLPTVPRGGVVVQQPPPHGGGASAVLKRVRPNTPTHSGGTHHPVSAPPPRATNDPQQPRSSTAQMAFQRGRPHSDQGSHYPAPSLMPPPRAMVDAAVQTDPVTIL